MNSDNNDDAVELEFHWSPSAITTDNDCREKGFWSKHAYGRGIRPAGDAFELDFGTLIHAALLDSPVDQPAMITANDAARAVQKLVEDHRLAEPMRTEWIVFTTALVYAFRSRVWPNILRDYEVIRTETELRPYTSVTMRDGRRFRLPWKVRPDGWLRHRKTGGKFYWEVKTTKLDQEAFVKSWERAPQVHLGQWAEEQLDVKGEAVEAAIVQGVHKGSTYKGSLRGALVCMYRQKGPLTKPAYQPNYKAGWERGLITEYPGGIFKWVDDLPVAVIADYFPVTEPIVADPDFVERLLVQAAQRAAEIQEWREACAETDDEPTLRQLLLRYFPRTGVPGVCRNPLTHRQCSMYECCWNPTVNKDPLASGLYVIREDESNGDPEVPSE